MVLARPQPGPTMEPDVLESYKDRFERHLSQTVPGRKELVVAEARDCTIKSADGRLFLDFISGIAVATWVTASPRLSRPCNSRWPAMPM